MSKNRVSPLSRKAIRDYANQIRKLLGYKQTDFINAPKLFDTISVTFAEQGLDFDYRILPDDDKIFQEKEEAYTDMSTGIIHIKESVMQQACKCKYARATFTLIHELGHYLLHYLQEDVHLTRVEDDVFVPAYMDPEWQADQFASEFLMPFDVCKKYNAEDIKLIYHVTGKAASVREDKILQELAFSK